MKSTQLEIRSCEICNGEAALYCHADAAFLCWGCDRRVHSANFLVARHIRRLVCSACHSFASSSDGDPALIVSGPGSGPIRSLCRSCDPDPLPPLSPSTSVESSCVSRADSDERPPRPAARRSASAAERVMEGWGKSIGLRRWRRCAGVAARVVGACGGGMTVLPQRAAMAGAMWFAVKICDRACGETLRRLQKCSGVPAKVIVFHEARIARAAAAAAARRRREALPVEEGWGECS